MVSQAVTTEAFPGASIAVLKGIPKGVWLVVGPPGAGKSTYSKQFIHEGLRAGQHGVYVSTEESPLALINSIRSYSPPLRSEVHDLLRIVDCYSWRAGEKTETQFAVANPSNLNDTNIAIESARKGITDFRYVLDSISSLALSAGPGATQKFLQISIARLRAANANGMCVAELGAHEVLFMNYLRFAFDGIIEMDFHDDGEELKRTFRIFSMRGISHSTNRFEFKINDQGINFSSSHHSQSTHH